MSPGDLSDDLDLQRRETEQLAAADEVVGVPLMAIVLDGVADVVEDGGVLEQLACARRQAEIRPECIEELERERRHLTAVGVGAGVARRQCLDAAPPAGG